MDIAELLVLPGLIDTVKIKPLFLLKILFQYSLNIPCKFQLISEFGGERHSNNEGGGAGAG